MIGPYLAICAVLRTLHRRCLQLLVVTFIGLQLVAVRHMAVSAQDSAPNTRPNIILIVADDLGYGDLSLTGAPDIATPNIDRLAEEGIFLDQAYANAPVCTPTRAALLTGQYQQRTGIDRVIFVSERWTGLSANVKLLPAFLKEASYATGMFGKWHLGFTNRSHPNAKGFDTFIGFLAGNIDYFAYNDRRGQHDLWSNSEPITDERYATDLIVDETIKYIDQQNDPFFAYIPFNAPHSPFQGPDDLDSAGMDVHMFPVQNRTREVYAAMVESMDQNIGRLLDHLDENGLAENTVVFFMSDNGGEADVASNAPFSNYKGTLFEGGIHVPLIARWTDHFPQGQVSSEPVIGMDLFPTILELAGVPPLTDHVVDGLSLVDLLTGTSQELPRDKLFFHNLGEGALLEGAWKYLRTHAGEEYLFKDDITETNNLAAAEVERLLAMRATYDNWYAQLIAESPYRLSQRPSKRTLAIAAGATGMTAVTLAVAGWYVLRRRKLPVAV